MSLEKYKQIMDEDFTKDADFIDKTIKNLRINGNLSPQKREKKEKKVM